jgi:hypothetical protein
MRLLLGSTAVALLAASALYGGFELQTDDGLYGGWLRLKQISEWRTSVSAKSEQSDPSVISRELQSAMCGGGQHEGVGVGGAAIPPKEISEWPIWPEVSGKVERAAMCGGCGQACGRVSGTSGSMAPGVAGQQRPPSAGRGCCGQRGTLVVLERLTDWLVGPTASEDREQQQCAAGSCACGTNMAMMSRMNASDPNRKGDIPKQ